VHSIVKTLRDDVAGVPVHLEAYDEASRRRVMDLQTTRTDLRSAYRFDGLAPGIYRVFATFEYQAPDAAAMEQAGVQQIEIEAKSDLQLDMDLYTRCLNGRSLRPQRAGTVAPKIMQTKWFADPGISEACCSRLPRRNASTETT
jgi:hypothetical protein